uniref:Uncharacterized protein n=1 Tax=Wuchereria bancrofti TaxID=6293 RepID=A0A1I8EV76_WUCBA
MQKSNSPTYLDLLRFRLIVDYSVGTVENLKEKTVESVRISGPPVLKSELAKQWIREVAKKTF